MKTLVNKQNPQIQITAPEIEVQEESEMYLIPVSDYCIPMCIDDWTLVEEKPKHTEVWVEGRTIFEQEGEPTEDWKEKRKKECPFRRNLDNNLYGCERYADVVCECDGNCSWVVDYPKLKEIQDKKKLDAEIEKELRTHYNDDQDVYWWNYLKNSFRHFYELGKKGGSK